MVLIGTVAKIASVQQSKIDQSAGYSFPQNESTSFFEVVLSPVSLWLHILLIYFKIEQQNNKADNWEPIDIS